MQAPEHLACAEVLDGVGTHTSLRKGIGTNESWTQDPCSTQHAVKLRTTMLLICEIGH